jgi:hypothetical protein
MQMDSGKVRKKRGAKRGHKPPLRLHNWGGTGFQTRPMISKRGGTRRTLSQKKDE